MSSDSTVYLGTPIFYVSITYGDTSDAAVPLTPDDGQVIFILANQRLIQKLS